jgi:hypothetical protein
MASTVTDVIPSDMMEQLGKLPWWAFEESARIVNPDCPPPGVLYPLAAPRKLHLQLEIAHALMRAADGDFQGGQVEWPARTPA